jgi:hypothetical protein
VTTRRNGLRSGQSSGQRNTVITPEMQAAQWKPGQSGNAGGRPKRNLITDELRGLLSELHPDQKKYPGKTRARVIAERMLAQAEGHDLAAQREVLDRVEGRVAVRSELCGPEGGAIPWLSFSREENEGRLQVLLRKAGLEN